MVSGRNIGASGSRLSISGAGCGAEEGVPLVITGVSAAVVGLGLGSVEVEGLLYRAGETF